MSTAFETYRLEDIPIAIQELGQPKFRAKQIIQWAYGKGAQSYGEMSNLPKSLRALLSDSMPLHAPQVIEKRVSKDGARKYVLRLSDGSLIETVGIPSRDASSNGMPRRLTVCFSTQVGCPMACSFCATGKEGFKRNLYPGEMAQQILVVMRDMGMRVTNAVAMGQGEPFLNYDNVIAALHIINHPDCLNIGARHITVSTCGVLNGIARFAQEPEQFTLALSLHSALQETRDQIMPKCSSVSLSDLKASLASYHRVSARRPSIEYLMITGVNDGREDLDALISFCKGVPVHVNLLPMNDIEGSPYRASDRRTMKTWIGELGRHGIEANIRDSRGSDIDGACGQLISKMI